MTYLQSVGFAPKDFALSEKLANCEVAELAAVIGSTPTTDAFESLIASKINVKHAMEKFVWFIRDQRMNINGSICGWPYVLACSPQFRRLFIQHGAAQSWPNIMVRFVQIIDTMSGHERVPAITFTRADASPGQNMVLIRKNDWQYATTGRAEPGASTSLCTVS